jgi:Fic family protein
MNFTPIIPTELSSGNIIQELLVLLEEIVVKSAMLEANYNPIVISAIRNMLRNVNSYYSNQIEAEGIHPIDTEKAMRKEYSLDDKERKLQMLSVAHVKTQKLLEKSITQGTNPLSKNFIKDIHKTFYSQEAMDNFLTVSNEIRTVNMIPGELRNDNVKVANHIAPLYDEVEHLMNQFESLYKLYPYMTISQKLIYVLSSYHRLVCIHPFLDGNGSVSRLFLDAFLHSIGIRGYGLWNISRGLSRDVKNYKANLNYADMIRQGNQDGRGYLSNRGLEQFVRFIYA